MKRKNNENNVSDNPLYHNTWKLLQKYRDVVWSLELSVQQVKNSFQIEYGNNIEDFLEMVYIAGANISGTSIEHHAKCIERSSKMIKLLEASIETLREKHKYGEDYYWILYFTFLIPQQLSNIEDIVDKLRPYIKDISRTTYYRKRQESIEVLSSILWGYTSKQSSEILSCFIPE